MAFPEPSWLAEAMRKYRRKLHHVKLAKQIFEIEKTVQDNMALAQARITHFQRKISALLNRLGVYSDWNPSYLAYATALDKSQRELDFMVDRIREHQILRDRWERRGLDTTVLDEIDTMVIYR